ncbi:MAG: virulence RhuM family protein [Leptospirales bacterium]
MTNQDTSEVLIYETEDFQVAVSVRLDDETVWLTQRQMAELFGTTPENILIHLKNIYADGELEESATAKESLAVRTEGTRQVRRKIKHYNLDTIISVGYRVNSRRGVKFRQWATRTLQEHLVQGYTFNARLGERGMAKARQALDLLTRTLAQHELVNEEGRAVLEMVQQYARTFGLLLAYDENRLPGTPVHPKPAVGLSLDKARADRPLSRDDKAHATRRGEK